MASSDTPARDESERAGGYLRPFAGLWNGFGRVWRVVARYLPKRLYARLLIIVIAPMILLQSVIDFDFIERHWQTATQLLSAALPRDIAAVIDMIATYPPGDNYAQVIRLAQERLQL